MSEKYRIFKVSNEIFGSDFCPLFGLSIFLYILFIILSEIYSFYSSGKPQDVPVFVTNTLKFMELLKGQKGLEIEDTMSENIPNVVTDLRA